MILFHPASSRIYHDRWAACSDNCVVGTRWQPVRDGSSCVTPTRRRCGEILTLEEQRLAGRASEGIGEAVAEVQPRLMMALAEPPPGLASSLDLIPRDRHQLDLGFLHEEIEVVPRGRATPAFDNHGCFQ